MEKINTIKEMYKEDRPYEKCEKFGAENLTDTELLAILIRTGTKGENSLELSRKLLYKNGFHNGLAGMRFPPQRPPKTTCLRDTAPG